MFKNICIDFFFGLLKEIKLEVKKSGELWFFGIVLKVVDFILCFLYCVMGVRGEWDVVSEDVWYNWKVLC